MTAHDPRFLPPQRMAPEVRQDSSIPFRAGHLNGLPHLVQPLGWDRWLLVVRTFRHGDARAGTALLQHGEEWYSAEVDFSTGEVSGVNAYTYRGEAEDNARVRAGFRAVWLCEGYNVAGRWVDCDRPMPHAHGIVADVSQP